MDRKTLIAVVICMLLIVFWWPIMDRLGLGRYNPNAVRPHATDTTRAWVDRTPDGFTFDVKAYSLFTEHAAPVVRLPKEIREALSPAEAAKKNLYRRDASKQQSR